MPASYMDAHTQSRGKYGISFRCEIINQLKRGCRYAAIGMALGAILVLAACGGDATATLAPTDVPASTQVPIPTPPPPTPTAIPEATPMPTAAPKGFDEDIASQLQAALEDAVASPDTSYPGAVLHVSSPDLGTWTGPGWAKSKPTLP